MGNLDDFFKAPTQGPALSASNIDDALDALSLTTGGTDAERKAVAGIDRHPERRQKAALAAFEDRRLPELRKEHPGLRLQQYKDLIFKEFQKVYECVSLTNDSRRRIRLIRYMWHTTPLDRKFKTLRRLRSGRLNKDLPRSERICIDI